MSTPRRTLFWGSWGDRMKGERGLERGLKGDEDMGRKGKKGFERSWEGRKGLTASEGRDEAVFGRGRDGEEGYAHDGDGGELHFGLKVV